MAVITVDTARIPDHLTTVPNELRALLDSLTGDITNWTLVELLSAMRLAFEVSKSSVVLLFFPHLKGFDENLHGFSGTYAFGTKDGLVSVSAIFKDEQLEIEANENPDWNVKVLFKDVQAFWKILFAGGDDILDSIVRNDVEVYGNLNYLYKFGYMARDLLQRLGL